MEETKAMERIYRILKDNFTPRQVVRILGWLDHKFEDERVKEEGARPREEVVRDRRLQPSATDPQVFNSCE